MKSDEQRIAELRAHTRGLDAKAKRATTKEEFAEIAAGAGKVQRRGPASRRSGARRMRERPPRGSYEGIRMRLVRDVERWPFFVAPAGAVGTVTYADDHTVCLRMDDHLPGAEEWDNEIVWSEATSNLWRWGDPIVALAYDATPILEVARSVANEREETT